MQKSSVYNVSAPSFVSGMGTKGRATTVKHLQELADNALHSLHL